MAEGSMFWGKLDLPMATAVNKVYCYSSSICFLFVQDGTCKDPWETQRSWSDAFRNGVHSSHYSGSSSSSSSWMEKKTSKVISSK